MSATLARRGCVGGLAITRGETVAMRMSACCRCASALDMAAAVGNPGAPTVSAETRSEPGAAHSQPRGTCSEALFCTPLTHGCATRWASIIAVRADARWGGRLTAQTTATCSLRTTPRQVCFCAAKTGLTRAVRKAHNAGRNHLQNVRDYYACTLAPAQIEADHHSAAAERRAVCALSLIHI